MRLIDADKLLEYEIVLNENMELKMVASQFIRTAPTIDAVPVVRCKDCKYWDGGDCYRLGLSLPDDFCSYGKREEELE